MIKSKRFSIISNLVNEKGSVSIQELIKECNSSESSIRADIIELDKMGKIRRVHGGACSINDADELLSKDIDVIIRDNVEVDEKKKIAKYAASLIKDNMFIYIDASSTTRYITNYLKAKNITVVTNSVRIGKELITKGITTLILGGTLKISTDAFIGPYACEMLKMFHFQIGFFGTNGISEEASFSTPEFQEALIKKEAMSRCKVAYVLADKTKFSKVSANTFGSLHDATIISNCDYDLKANIININKE